MFNDRPIQFDEHLSWINRSLHDEPTGLRRIFIADGQPSGFFSLTSIDNTNRSCVWGGYLAPEVPRGRGYGKAMLYESLRIAFGDLYLHRVVVEAIVGNDRAIALYDSVGFRREGILRNRAQQSHGYVDVVIMGILEFEWTSDHST